jgi:hypothetical protein
MGFYGLELLFWAAIDRNEKCVLLSLFYGFYAALCGEVDHFSPLIQPLIPSSLTVMFIGSGS